MDALQPGIVVAGRYRLVRLLGRGATKVVYLATDVLARADVALALLAPANVRDPTLGARFSREGRAASVLRSPYVARVYDVGKLADGTRYLATEAVLGRDLADALSLGPCAPAQAARWTLQVLAALEEAHARGILHRDVKPENVLLAPTEAGEAAKLTDFGLAKVLDAALEGSVLLRTAQNVALGTPEYMPPEQWQGGAVDARSDLYAVGVMLYEMLLGRPPFQRTVLHALCVAHLTEAPPPFPADAPAAVRALEPVVQRALEKRAADRFASAREMRAALEAAAGFSLPDAPDAPSPQSLLAPFAAAELLCDAWPGAVRLVAASSARLGRDPGAHVPVRCLPAHDENLARARTVSRSHARIEWRGGRPWLADEGSRSGTTVGGRAVGRDAVELRGGDEIALGPHVRFAFEQARCEPGELPRWARLVRTDPFGGAQTCVLVLTEAKLSSAADAALWVPPALAGGDMLRVRAERGLLTVLSLGAPEPVPLVDGQVLRLGRLAISVAVTE